MQHGIRTERLKEAHGDVYQEFFSRTDLVVSGHVSFSWFPTGIGHRSHYAYIKSKAPLKMYVGVRRRHDDQVVIGDIIAYDLATNEFATKSLTDFSKRSDAIQTVVRHVWEEFGGEGGLEITVLSEVERGHGLGFSGALSGLVGLALYHLTSDGSDEYDHARFDGDAKELVFAAARKIERVAKYGNTAGSNILNCLYPSQIPAVCVSEEFSSDIKVSEVDQFHSSIHPLVEDLDGMLDDLPLDYAVVFSGQRDSTRRIEQLKQGDKRQFALYHEFYDQHFKIGDGERDYVHNLFNEKDEYQQIADALSVLSVRNIYLMRELYLYGGDDARVRAFLTHMNDCRDVAGVLEGEDEFAQALLHVIREHAGDEPVGIMPIYSGRMGGDYLVAMRLGEGSTMIPRAVEYLKSVFGGVQVHIASWDQHMYGGVTVDQRISQDQYSPYIKKGYVSYLTADGQREIGHYDELMQAHSDGIILDAINNKVFIKGRKLTKEDIKSQTTTVEVVGAVIRAGGGPVESSQFPPSTLTRQQNQMLGKIVGPLRKLTEKEFGEELPLQCTGSLREFSLSLGPSEIPIGVIQRISDG